MPAGLTCQSEIEGIVDKAIAAAVSVVWAEFGKLFDELGNRVQSLEDKVDHLEDSFSQAHDHEAIRHCRVFTGHYLQ